MPESDRYLNVTQDLINSIMRPNKINKCFFRDSDCPSEEEVTLYNKSGISVELLDC